MLKLFQTLPNFNFFAFVPVTIATVERSNSALKYVKTDLRSTIRQEQLNSLLLLFIHKDKDIALDYDTIMNVFADKHPRRMLLSNLLAEWSLLYIHVTLVILLYYYCIH